jgi:hypothetical protein
MLPVRLIVLKTPRAWPAAATRVDFEASAPAFLTSRPSRKATQSARNRIRGISVRSRLREPAE